jgi:hypothetical protein
MTDVVDTTTHFDDAAVAEVVSIYEGLNYYANGIDFGSLIAKVQGQDDSLWSCVWTTGFQGLLGATIGTFFRSNANGDFRMFGDVMSTAFPFHDGKTDGLQLPPGTLIFAASKSDPTAVAPPTGFQWIADDHGSGNKNNIAYFIPTAPAGYVALGLCWGINGATPNPDNYWCVRKDLVRVVGSTSAWGDGRQGWESHDGSLVTPQMTLAAQQGIDDGELLLIPPTFQPVPDTGTMTSYALLLEQPDLPVTVKSVTPTQNAETGTRLPAGNSKLTALPWSAIANDSSFPNRAVESPFYFIASQPYWESVEYLPATGGSYTSVTTLGVEEEQSVTFEESTSLEVSASFGLDISGVSASVSTTYTRSFALTTSKTVGTNTSVQVTKTLPFPPGAVQASLWQKWIQIAVIRCDGTVMAAQYGQTDLIMTGSTTPPSLD